MIHTALDRLFASEYADGPFKDTRYPDQVVEDFRVLAVRSYGPDAGVWVDDNYQSLLADVDSVASSEQPWFARMQHELGGEIIVTELRRLVEGDGEFPLHLNLNDQYKAKQLYDRYSDGLYRAKSDESMAMLFRLSNLAEPVPMIVTVEVIDALWGQLVAIADSQVAQTEVMIEEFGIGDQEFELFKTYFGVAEDGLNLPTEQEIIAVGAWDDENPIRTNGGDVDDVFPQLDFFSMNGLVCVRDRNNRIDYKAYDPLIGLDGEGRQNYIDRAEHMLGAEPAFNHMTEDDQTRTIASIKSTSNALLTMQSAGCGATYVGHDGSEASLIVTAAHCIKTDGPVIQGFITLDGRFIEAELVYVSRPDLEDRTDSRVYAKGGDFAVFSTRDPWLKENAEPAQMRLDPLTDKERLIATSSYHREAEIVVFDEIIDYREDRSFIKRAVDYVVGNSDNPSDPRQMSRGQSVRNVGADSERGGYSGGGLFDLGGFFVGVISSGDGINQTSAASRLHLIQIMQWLGLDQEGLQKVDILDNPSVVQASLITPLDALMSGVFL